MSNKIEFSTTTFGGFDKKQVLDYLYKVHKEKDDREKEFEKELEQASQTISEWTDKASESEIKIQELEIELQEARTTLDKQSFTAKDEEREHELLNNIADFQKQISQYENLIAKLQKEKEEIAQRKDSVSNISSEEYEEFRIKKQELEDERQKINESSAQIGRVLLDAHNKADDIISDAKYRSEKIIEQAHESIEVQRIKANQVIMEHREKVEKETQQKIRVAQIRAEEEIEKAELQSKNIAKEIVDAAKETGKYLDTLKEQVESLSAATQQALENMQQSAAGEFRKSTSSLDFLKKESEEYVIPPFEEISPKD